MSFFVTNGYWATGCGLALLPATLGCATGAEPEDPGIGSDGANVTRSVALNTGTEAKGKAADLVLVNGKVITVDRRFTVTEAVAVKDGKIQDVGPSARMAKYVGPETQVLDLGGKSVLPGINDTHTHANEAGVAGPPIGLVLSYPTVQSISDVVAALEDKVATAVPGEWVRGNGWNPSQLLECQLDPTRNPTRWDLDPVSPANPVVFYDFSHHSLWANSLALELAGIDSTTSDPPGGVIVRNAAGEPTGLLVEGAMKLMEAVVPPLSKDQVRTGVLKALQQMAVNGITSFTDAALAPGSLALEVYSDLASEGLLTARVQVLLVFGNGIDEFRQNLDSYPWPVSPDEDWLRFPGIKLFADGIPPSRTAWLWEPYVGGGVGSLVTYGATDEEKQQQLVDMIVYGHSKGAQLAIHAGGDRAVTACIDGFEAAERAYPNVRDRRHYLIHGELIRPDDCQRAAKLRVGINMQPFMQYRSADTIADLLGPERGAYQWPYKTAMASGMNVAFSSDMPAAPLDWKLSVRAAVLREGISGVVSGPEERITLEQALRGYTTYSAWEDHMEDAKGSIEKGKFADLSVLGGDILNVDVHAIPSVPVVMTIVGGRIVYDAAAP